MRSSQSQSLNRFQSVTMVTCSLTFDLRFRQMTVQVLIDRWVNSSSLCVSLSVPVCVFHLSVYLYLSVSQVGVSTVLSTSNWNLSLPEDSRLSGSQQSPQTLGLMQGNLTPFTSNLQNSPLWCVMWLWLCPGAAEGPVRRGNSPSRVCKGRRLTGCFLLTHRS